MSEKSTKSANLIQLAIIYIKNNDKDGLEKLLELMPLEKLDDRGIELLAGFLGASAKYNRKDMVKPLIKRWKKGMYVSNEDIQFKSKLFLMPIMNASLLAFVVSAYDDYTYLEIMDDVIQGDNSPEVHTALMKIDEIFGNQPYETYEEIKKHAEEKENWIVEEYMIEKMKETAPYAEKPVWVKNYTNSELKTESELYDVKTGVVSFELPSDNEAVELLTEGLHYLGLSILDVNRAKEMLLQKLSISTREEKIKLLEPVIKNNMNVMLGEDESLFRIFGPANPLVDQDLTMNGKSNLYGGCRMFLCDIFDWVEDDNYYADWFTGVCDYCNMRIMHRWYAIRKPKVHGGWVGCYCKWDCVEKSIFEESQEPNLGLRELIKIFSNKINEIGIQDRLPDN